MKKILVSGIKPTGELHLGNYFGAMKQFVDMQNSGEYDPYVFLADYHALNFIQDREAMQKLSFDLICGYLAAGLDPQDVTLYRQSQLPEHTELCWIFNTLITMPLLMRAHAFKDAEAKSKDISVGTFDYPVLMAADILMYDADIVPVGQDQKQHVEMAREIARKFNQTFGQAFIEPAELIEEAVAIVPGTDGRKMSKSYGNVIPLFGSDDAVKKAVMSITTDSKDPDEEKDPESIVIYQLYKLVAGPEDLSVMEKGFREGGLSYGDAKKMLLQKILDYFAPMKARYDELQKDPAKVFAILADGEARARQKAAEKMRQVKMLTGLIKS